MSVAEHPGVSRVLRGQLCREEVYFGPQEHGEPAALSLPSSNTTNAPVAVNGSAGGKPSTKTRWTADPSGHSRGDLRSLISIDGYLVSCRAPPATMAWLARFTKGCAASGCRQRRSQRPARHGREQGEVASSRRRARLGRWRLPVPPRREVRLVARGVQCPPPQGRPWPRSDGRSPCGTPCATRRRGGLGSSEA